MLPNRHEIAVDSFAFVQCDIERRTVKIRDAVIRLNIGGDQQDFEMAPLLERPQIRRKHRGVIEKLRGLCDSKHCAGDGRETSGIPGLNRLVGDRKVTGQSPSGSGDELFDFTPNLRMRQTFAKRQTNPGGRRAIGADEQNHIGWSFSAAPRRGALCEGTSGRQTEYSCWEQFAEKKTGYDRVLLPEGKLCRGEAEIEESGGKRSALPTALHRGNPNENMERRRLELLTSSMPLKRSPN